MMGHNDVPRFGPACAPGSARLWPNLGSRRGKIYLELIEYRTTTPSTYVTSTR